MKFALATLALLGALIALVAWTRSRHRAHRTALAAAPPPADLATERQLAAAQERERILRDLHDDLGAKLLGLVYAAPTPEYADRAREVLADLRDVVSRSRRPPARLLELLEELRVEAAGRLASARIELAWEQAPDLPDPQLDQGQTLHLARITREAVTNAIRHARAQRLRVRSRALGGELLLDITDDGAFEAGRAGSGSGTTGMRERAAELQGDIRWDPGTLGGTKVVLRFPLPKPLEKSA